MINNQKYVYIVDGARTPFLKALGKPNPLTASDLAVAAAQSLLARQPFHASEIDEVITGCVAPSMDETNIARVIALRLGCGEQVPAWTVQRNCASGLQALDCAFLDIMAGRADLVLAGGTECMSRQPLVWPMEMVEWLADLKKQPNALSKFKHLAQFRPQFLKPIFSILRGLTDPIIHQTMGQTAENLAYQFGISRREMDEYAAESHKRALSAQENHRLEEIRPLFDNRGHWTEKDAGVRLDSTLEKLGKLKPAFDKPFGNVTAGNSSQISDGAAFLILASEKAVKKHQLPILGRIVDTAWAALDPALMGLGPVFAIQKLLSHQQRNPQEIEYWEINEAFSAQVLACLKAMEDTAFMQTHFQSMPVSIPLSRLNVDGGAIALGHPVGASGARLVLHLLQVLKRNQARFGVASLCIGGGQGGAILVEHITEIV